MLTEEQHDQFSQLWQEAYPRIYARLRQCGGSHEDVQDALGEAALRAYQAFPRYDPAKASFYTWLLTIALRELWHIWRKRATQHRLIGKWIQREIAIAQLVVIMDDAPVESDIEIEPLGDCDFQELVARLFAAAEAAPTQPRWEKELQKRYLTIVTEMIRRACKGLPVTQAAIARSTGISTATVSRCFAFLRRALEE